jgi:hypothetical protein
VHFDEQQRLPGGFGDVGVDAGNGCHTPMNDVHELTVGGAK